MTRPRYGRQHYTKQWLAYPCPICQAGPGHWCETYNGQVKREPHADRARLAAADQWRGPP